MAPAARVALGFAVAACSQTAAVKMGLSDLRLSDEGGKTSAACAQAAMSFDDFTNKYGRAYRSGTQEYEMRRVLFEQHRARAERHNCRSEGATWTAGITHLADWTASELASLRGYKSHRPAQQNSYIALNTLGLTIGEKSEVDWRRKRRNTVHEPNHLFPEKLSWANTSIIRKPQDQGTCGSCWAFATAVVLSARAEIARRPFSDFSVSQILSCAPNPHECGGKGGCQGATANIGFEYVLQAGSVSGRAFPYPTKDYTNITACPSSMQVDSGKTTVEISFGVDGSEEHRLPRGGSGPGMRGADIGMLGWTRLPQNKEAPVLKALMDGPVAISVMAGMDWNLYTGGILAKDGCSQDYIINHAVVLFGWDAVRMPGAAKKIRYWHVKNSWSRYWGERGNLRLERLDNEEGYCGWDEHPELGNGCKGGASKVWVCGSCGIIFDVSAPLFAALPGAAHSDRKR